MRSLLFSRRDLPAIGLIAVAFSILTACSSSKNLPTATPEQVQEAILSNNWVFVAQSVIPQGGRSRILDSRYEVRTSKDTVNCYLPYFGQSYSGSGMMSNSNPMDFRSTKFTVDREEGKKGGYRVRIRPSDVNSVQFMNFDLYDNGNASLNVTLTDRSSITYNGYVQPRYR
jgi:hypothetical protein